MKFLETPIKKGIAQYWRQGNDADIEVKEKTESKH